MKKLLFVLLLVPFCTTFTVGCGSSEPTVIEQTPETEAALEAEAEEAEAEMETTE